MARQLLILRHAKSDWDAGAATDFDRPLAKRGRRDARRVGEVLRDGGPIPDLVVASPARRAAQTARRVCKRIGIAREAIQWDELIYEAPPGTLLKVLADRPPAAGTVMLVGHNPGLEELVRFLCGPDVPEPSDGKLMPTAALACVSLPEDWTALQPGAGRLLWLRRPGGREWPVAGGG